MLVQLQDHRQLHFSTTWGSQKEKKQQHSVAVLWLFKYVLYCSTFQNPNQETEIFIENVLVVLKSNSIFKEG